MHKNYLQMVAYMAVIFLSCFLFGCTVSENPAPTEPTVSMEAETEPQENAPEETLATEPQEIPETIPTAEPTVPEPTEPTPTEPEPTEETQPTDPTPETEPVHTHKYKITEVDANCSRKGYTLHECSCGDSYKDNYKDKLDHSYTEKVVEPTTEAKGYTLHTCTVCGKKYKDNYTDRLVEETTPPKQEEPTEPTPTEPEPTKPEEKPGTGGNGGSGSGQGTPETEDYGYCPKCGRRIWTTWYREGCFSFLVDTVCECGKLVHANECHHH